MGGATGYAWFRLRNIDQNVAGLQQALSGTLPGILGPHGAGVWGAFAGYFGLDSRNLLLIVSHPLRSPDVTGLVRECLPVHVHVEEAADFLPTARPLNAAPLTIEGLHVHRFFDVAEGDVDEFVSLSVEAWETFEASDSFRSTPRGLFRSRSAVDGKVRMLLVTWYDGFSSWETSRSFPPAAARNFQRRAAITIGTTAIATRLLR